MKAEKFKKSKKVILCAALFLLAAGILSFHIYRSYRHPIVREVTIDSDKIDSPVRFVFLSDLHESVFGEKNEELYGMVRSLDPDLILVGGDMVNWRSEDDDYVYETVRGLSQIADVYYALGNHEIEFMNFRGDIVVTGNDRITASYNLPEDPDKGLVFRAGKAGATVLQRDWKDLEIRGSRIRIGAAYEGMYSLDEKDPMNTLLQGMQSFLTEYQDTDAFTLYITHRPSSYLLGNASQLWNFDAVLCGHEHGGQVYLPFLGGFYSRERGIFPGMTRGSFLIGETNLIVSAGLGSNSEPLPRFNNPPEIVLLTIE